MPGKNKPIGSTVGVEGGFAGIDEAMYTGPASSVVRKEDSMTSTPSGGLLPADPEIERALERLATDLEEQVRTAPDRAHAIIYRSYTEAKKRLWAAQPLRRLAQAARALVEAQRNRTVPDLLGRVRTRQQLTILLGEIELPLPPPAQKALASAGLLPGQAQAASAQLLALLPTPDSREERLADLALFRVELSLEHQSEIAAAPVEALDRLLDQVRLRPGLTILNLSAGAGDLAQRLAEREWDVSVLLTESKPKLREHLRRLVALYPLLHLDEEQDVSGLIGQYSCILLRPPGRWQLQRTDGALLRRAYETWLEGGGQLVALVDGEFGRNDLMPATLQTWVETVGGRIEQLNGPAYQVPLYLIVIDKPCASEVENV